MTKFKRIACALLLVATAGAAIAQNNTNSPYTRYGYGDLANQTFGNSKAMGGVAFGMRDGMHINPLNPASYTAIDSLTFLFDGGVSLQNVNVSDGDRRMNLKNSSFDYIAMQFRLNKRLAMSVGLLPFSNVGYNVSSVETNDGLKYAKTLVGEGGIHQLYGGLGVKVFENLSVGANVAYFRGDITRTLTLSYAASSYTKQAVYEVNDYRLDFGVQYTKNFGKKHTVTLGAVFSPKHETSSTYTLISGTDALTMSTVEKKAEFGVPNSFGGGLTYGYDKRLTVGLDYSLQKWGEATYMDERNAFCDRTKISVGAEYVPSMTGRSYFGQIKYRLGAYYLNPYYKTEAGERAAREYGVTGGLGLPLPRTRSMLNLSAQYVRVKGLQTGMLDENIWRLGIGLTFNERWFFKRKVD